MMLTPEQRDELKAAAYGRGFVHDGLLRAVLAHIDAQSQQLNTQRIMIEAQSAVKGRIRDEASKRGRDASSTVSELEYLIELIDAKQARIAELEKDAARLREFAAKVAQQTPEKPDYWSSCGQCANNASEAEDLIEVAPAVWPEDASDYGSRIAVIGQNGATGEHYDEERKP